MAASNSDMTPRQPLPGKKRRALLDRRSGEDRRKAYNLDYFLNGGVERRKGDERRSLDERRSDWKRVGKWYSVFCEDI
jgi:hypothetical protein